METTVRHYLLEWLAPRTSVASTGKNTEKREPLVLIVGETVMVLTANSKPEIELL